ncbi:Protein of unknown function [Nocardia amikacinitolerans]|uniref:DUF4254 domain-containing protein n=1 Tax=Nocardia amikacinitolerans TaxID=756689 RepID=A0A285LWD4_9NOCA|nr:DUF4254 domain-containing protein [Nocardia amikacinitolerans]SNY89249.1 Protein of unknown function [Nocardia amikacinitolerans]
MSPATTDVPLTAPLPTRRQLLRACRGDASVVHPLASHARELTLLHHRRLDGDAVHAMDERRAELVRAVDRWARAHLPVARGAAYLHTEGLGTVIDRLAERTAHAYTALTKNSDWDLWFAWERLAELAVAYEDLADELHAGRRRLPDAP